MEEAPYSCCQVVHLSPYHNLHELQVRGNWFYAVISFDLLHDMLTVQQNLSVQLNCSEEIGRAGNLLARQ